MAWSRAASGFARSRAERCGELDLDRGAVALLEADPGLDRVDEDRRRQHVKPGVPLLHRQALASIGVLLDAPVRVRLRPERERVDDPLLDRYASFGEPLELRACERRELHRPGRSWIGRSLAP